MNTYEKKYKEALGWMQSIYPTMTGADKEDAEHFFPELKESEDERIRKELIELISWMNDVDPRKKDWLAWLEKQGKQNPVEWSKEDEKIKESIKKVLANTNFNKLDIKYSFCEMISWLEKQKESSEIKAKLFLISKGYPIDANGIFPTYEEMYNIIRDGLEKQYAQKHFSDFNANYWYVSKVDGKIHNMTYNPTGKVKPKFNVDDFIANDYCSGKVIEITNDAYLLDTGQGIPFSYEHNAHLWTIKDAKDGDVLVTPPIEGLEHNEQIFIFKAINNRDYIDDCIEYYGRLCDGVFYKNKTGYMGTTLDTFYPATNEQRELLFQKMEEAGYEWDANKKELKKFEPKFNVDDWIVADDSYGRIICHIDAINNNLIAQGYAVSDENGLIHDISFSEENKWHKWTIADAKDGDVIVCNINKAEIGGDVEKLPNITPTIFMYQNVVKDSDYIHSYCALYDESSLVLQNTMYYNKFVDNIHPATKKQRDLLFQKMKEVGYKWDAESKELNKIESKTLDANKVIEWLKTTIKETEEYFGEHGEYCDIHLTLPYNSIEDLINNFKEFFVL